MRVLSAFIQTFSGVRCNVLDANGTVASIVNGKSLIRFGDGEFGIYMGHSIHYQPWSESLLAEFISIRAEYEQKGDSCGFLLAVPMKYMQCSGFVLGRKRVLVSSWSESRRYFKNNFNRRYAYGDSFLFEKKNKNVYSLIWSQPGDTRKIIFVHNNAIYANDFANTYHREVIHVPCPSKDAFASYNHLYQSIIDVIHKNELTHNDIQIVLSAGPAGKVLAYHLTKKGYQCVDAGHCWDEPLES
jgi:hypothetical protein